MFRGTFGEWRMTFSKVVTLIAGLGVVPAFASDVPTLNVLAPLGTLPYGLVKSFEDLTGSRVRVGFLGRASDTGPRVRQDALVWDVVISTSFEIGKLSQTGQIFSPPSSEGGVRDLLWDPVGLICRFPSAESRTLEFSWSQLSRNLIDAHLLGELVLDLTNPLHVALAGRMVSDEKGQAFAPLESPRLKGEVDPRWTWLREYFWKARPARMSVEAEILRDQVSCVVSFLSRYHHMQKLFKDVPEKLRFVIPDRRTIATVFQVALTQETARPELSLAFAKHLQQGVGELVTRSGLCPFTSDTSQKTSSPGPDSPCHSVDWFGVDANVELKPEALEELQKLQSGEAFVRRGRELRP